MLDKRSKVYYQTATRVEGELSPVIKKAVPTALAVKVTGFTSGSTMASFFVAVNETAAKANNTVYLITQAIKNGITNQNFSTIVLDTTNVTVKGIKYHVNCLI